MKKLILLVLLTLTATEVPAPVLVNSYRFAAAGGPSVAPTFVAASTPGSANGSVSCTATHTIAAGSNRLLLVLVGQGNSTSPTTISSVEWSGNGTPQSLTAIPGFTATDGNWNHVAGYYLVAPTPEVAGTITVTFATAPSLSAVLGANYTGAAQSSIFGTAVTANQTSSTTVTVTATTGTGQMNWAACATDANGAITIGGTASATSRVEIEGVIVGAPDTGYAVGDTTGSGTITWTWAGADNGGSIATIPVNGL
jgi:hypothetical protein